METVDPDKCPLCGKDNECLNVKCGGGPENNCWCNNTEITFPEELTQQVPEEKRRKACICEACARAFHASQVNN